jgi:hypothetical protein
MEGHIPLKDATRVRLPYGVLRGRPLREKRLVIEATQR